MSEMKGHRAFPLEFFGKFPILKSSSHDKD
jgi:hypothetical protein